MTATQASADTKIVRCNPNSGSWQVHADICVIGSGAADMSAAIEAARAGRRIVLVDSMPALGGQAVNSSIASVCGLFCNGTHGFRRSGAPDMVLALCRRSAKSSGP